MFERFFKPRGESASVAKNRLMITLAQERATASAPDFLPLLQRDILAVVAKYVELPNELIRINLEQHNDTSILEINVELDKAKLKRKLPAVPEAGPLAVAP